MSNLLKECIQRERFEALPCDAIELLIEPREKDLGGFSVRRVLPITNKLMVGPWIFFDHMGPAHFPAGKGIDVRPHPHINLATVTYIFEGEIHHRDSLGNVQTIQAGDINLMVAGHGIVHSERESPNVHQREHSLHGLQLWLALPEKDEETEPAFYHYAAEEIPTVNLDGVAIRVMMGSAYGVTSPVKTFAETLYLEAYLKPGQRIAIPAAQERALYVAAGNLKQNETIIPEYTMAVFTAKPDIIVEATQESRIAIIGGENLGERHIFWNFVSSKKERIEAAKNRWRDGLFPKIPGDENDYIPLP